MMRSQKHLRKCSHCTVKTTFERRLRAADGGHLGWEPCCIRCGVGTPEEATPLLDLAITLARQEFQPRLADEQQMTRAIADADHYALQGLK